MKPEEKARVKIDQWLTEAGWKVINRDEFEADSNAVAVREALLKGNKEADYFLFINGMAVGVLEAKREEIDVAQQIVCDQAEGYARGVPSYYTAYQKPLPFIYTSNASTIIAGTIERKILPTKKFLSCINLKSWQRCLVLKILLQDCRH